MNTRSVECNGSKGVQCLNIAVLKFWKCSISTKDPENRLVRNLYLCLSSINNGNFQISTESLGRNFHYPRYRKKFSFYSWVFSFNLEGVPKNVVSGKIFSYRSLRKYSSDCESPGIFGEKKHSLKFEMIMGFEVIACFSSLNI